MTKKERTIRLEKKLKAIKENYVNRKKQEIKEDKGTMEHQKNLLQEERTHFMRKNTQIREIFCKFVK